jgi:hypothetical protein
MLPQFRNLFTDHGLMRNLLVGLIAIFIERGAKVIYRFLADMAAASHSFRLSGFWLASFYNEQSKCTKYELVQIRHRGDELTCKFSQYNDANDEIEWLCAVGVLRGANLAAVYCPISPERAGIGALVLRLRTRADERAVLAGQWMEFRTIDGADSLIRGGEEYVLHRIQISLYQRARFFFRQRCFSGHDELKRLVTRTSPPGKSHAIESDVPDAKSTETVQLGSTLDNKS